MSQPTPPVDPRHIIAALNGELTDAYNARIYLRALVEEQAERIRDLEARLAPVPPLPEQVEKVPDKRR